ncbi:MAG: response regulator transcription factor [Frankiaceae bacterium]|jgi:DNA-binding NarL/FixJ family response regulator|nr:response regulator transcription factor [Frankiaceae bacterium]
MTVHVVLADDQALLRATFTLLIDSTPDLAVVGEAGTGSEAVTVVRQTRPDIVLMDIRMPEMDGISATRAITTDPELSDVKIVMLTTFEVEELIVEALRAGASGFLGKGVEPAELLDAIRIVAEGDSLLSPTATAAVIAHVVAQPAAAGASVDADRLAELTTREKEILTLVGLGLSNVEISERLFISPVTAKTHVNRTMTKLGVRDRAQLVIAAYENGLVTPGHRRQS